MSFPKAKLHRFNDDVSCAPPPGTYDPKNNEKVKGVVLSSTKRFPDQLCISSSLDSIDKAMLPSVTFRTPQVMRKKVELTPRLKFLQEKNFDTPGCSTASSDGSCDRKLVVSKGKNQISLADYKRLERELSALADQHWNELLERDLEINKLKEDLIEIKVHEEELKAILEEKNKIASERSKELLEVKSNLDMFVERIEKERQDQKSLVDKLQENIDTLQSQREDLESVITEKQTALLLFNDKYVDLENELKVLREEKEMHHAKIMKMEQINADILDRVITETGLEIENLERNLNMKVKVIEKEFCAAHRKEQVDFQSKLNMVSYEFEERKKEMQNKMEECLRKIIELEKLVNQKSKDFSNDIKESDERCKYMYRALCSVEKERDELLESDLEKNSSIIEIQEKCKAFEGDLNQYKAKCKRYEVTLSTMQGTVNALSLRLLESENEVERLNNVEFDLEGQKSKLEEDVQGLLSEITALRFGMDKMETDIINDVTAVKEQLTTKVEHLKVEGMKQVNILHNTINEKQRTIDVLLKENNHYKKDIQKKDINIQDLREKVKKHQEEVIELRHRCSKMEEDFNEKLSAQKNIYNMLSDELENANTVISELQNLKSNHENQIIVLSETVNKFETVSDSCKKEIASLNQTILKQSNDITQLKHEIKGNQLVMESQIMKETKQQQCLEKITSDYEAEKEKYSTLESESDNIKALLLTQQEDLNKKTTEAETLAKSMECLRISLKQAEDTIAVIQEKNTTLENQLAQDSKYTSEGSQIMIEAVRGLQEENEYLQSQLSFAKEKMETETTVVQRDNINKAELIVELSVKIDCLEAEKSSLALQLGDANSNSLALRLHIEDKDKIINSLTTQKNLAVANYEDSLIQIDNLHKAIRKDNEEQKLHVLTEIKLADAEVKINELEDSLAAKESELERLNRRMEELQNQTISKEEVQVLNMRLKQVSEDRDKANDQLAELLGHQNIQQKIKHVNQLKQKNVELKQAFNEMEIENTILKKKLADIGKDIATGKENSAPRSNSSQLNMRKKTTPKKVTASPSVLKDHNY